MMDVLSAYQPRATASLNDIAVLCGFPGKLGIDGSAVQGLYDTGDLSAIRHYCETDVMTTYLVYLRFQRLRGQLSAAAYHADLDKARQWLADKNDAHLQEYLQAWQAIY